MPVTFPQKKTLNLEAARVALAACEAEALRNQWTVVIAIVDDGGHPIIVQRLDGTQYSSVETAIGKARTAIAFKRPTRVLEEMIAGGRAAFLSMPGPMVFVQGGLPIEVDGTMVGAIGVSGVKSAQDEAVALAGVRALTP
jgi:uncharacterized protein GlcG (DUF336 family)